MSNTTKQTQKSSKINNLGYISNLNLIIQFKKKKLLPINFSCSCSLSLKIGHTPVKFETLKQICYVVSSCNFVSHRELLYMSEICWWGFHIFGCLPEFTFWCSNWNHLFNAALLSVSLQKKKKKKKKNPLLSILATHIKKNKNFQLTQPPTSSQIHLYLYLYLKTKL